MFEHSKAPVASERTFRKRIFKAGSFSFAIFFVSLAIGIAGYEIFAGMDFYDSFLNASMILGGMGPVGNLPNNCSKIFAGVYALYSGIIFLLSMAIIAAPIVHRFQHKFHIERDKES